MLLTEPNANDTMYSVPSLQGSTWLQVAAREGEAVKLTVATRRIMMMGRWSTDKLVYCPDNAARAMATQLLAIFPLLLLLLLFLHPHPQTRLLVYPVYVNTQTIATQQNSSSKMVKKVRGGKTSCQRNKWKRKLKLFCLLLSAAVHTANKPTKQVCKQVGDREMSHKSTATRWLHWLFNFLF